MYLLCGFQAVLRTTVVQGRYLANANDCPLVGKAFFRFDISDPSYI